MVEQRKSTKSAASEEEDRLLDILQTAMRRADKASAEMRDALFERAPPGSKHAWVLKLEKARPGSGKIFVPPGVKI